MFNSTAAQTETALGWVECLLLLSGSILVVGLIGEYRKSERWRKFVKAFELLVIVGVAGELIADGGIFLLSRKLEQLSESDIARLNLEAGIARKDASKAVERAAEAERNLAEANEHAANALKSAEEARRDSARFNKIAEDERLARVKLEERFSGREISDEALASIAAILQKFSGQTYTVTTFWELKEPVAFANRIHRVLISAGWNYQQSHAVLLGGQTGVKVYVHPEAKDAPKEAAKALVAALIDAGFEAEVRAKNNPGHPDDGLAINVGTKY